MRLLMSLLMLSCLKATELVEKKIYFRLSVFERIKLLFHTRNCEVCHHYQKQSVWLDKVLKRFLARDTSEISPVLPADLQSNIIQKIEAA
jgi:hypothetical protein